MRSASWSNGSAATWLGLRFSIHRVPTKIGIVIQWIGLRENVHRKPWFLTSQETKKNTKKQSNESWQPWDNEIYIQQRGPEARDDLATSHRILGTGDLCRQLTSLLDFMFCIFFVELLRVITLYTNLKAKGFLALKQP